MAQLIKANGETDTVTPKNGRVFETEELQAFVGGYIEQIGTADGRCMVLNEEGKLYDLPVNLTATEIADIFPWDVILGDVIVCTWKEAGAEEDGDED